MWQVAIDLATPLKKKMNIRWTVNVALVAAQVALGSLLSACSNGSKPNGATRHSEEIKEHIAEVKDSAVMVRLVGVSDDSISVLNNQTGKPQTFDYTRALIDHTVKGSLSKGDTLSVVPIEGGKAVKSVVNISELLGRWFYDMPQHRGFRFEYGGTMSSFNNQLVSYNSWRVLNGTLFLYYVGMQQAAESEDDYQVDTAQIESLSREYMELTFRGTRLKCQRLNKVLKLSDVR